VGCKKPRFLAGLKKTLFFSEKDLMFLGFFMFLGFTVRRPDSKL